MAPERADPASRPAATDRPGPEVAADQGGRVARLGQVGRGRVDAPVAPAGRRRVDPAVRRAGPAVTKTTTAAGDHATPVAVDVRRAGRPDRKGRADPRARAARVGRAPVLGRVVEAAPRVTVGRPADPPAVLDQVRAAMTREAPRRGATGATVEVGLVAAGPRIRIGADEGGPIAVEVARVIRDARPPGVRCPSRGAGWPAVAAT